MNDCIKCGKELQLGDRVFWECEDCARKQMEECDNKNKQIAKLEKQLADVKNSCDYYMKRSNDLVLKLAEKDKLIKDYADEHAMLQYKIADLVVKEIKAEDFAIEQLEKVKKYADIDFRKNCYIDAVGLDKFIDNQIKGLKGD